MNFLDWALVICWCVLFVYFIIKFTRLFVRKKKKQKSCEEDLEEYSIDKDIAEKFPNEGS